MKINTRKPIIERIDDAIKATIGTVESIELDRAERHELYKMSGSGRFTKSMKSCIRRQAHRGYFLFNGMWIDVLAQEECE
jgi:hypothetical protein